MNESKLDNKVKATFNEIKNELANLETFLEVDDDKSERFKNYLKCLYDYIKIEDLDGEDGCLSPPELIIDRKCVDLEQIYQQLQLLNSDSATSSVGTFTKFFAKCLVNADALTFGIGSSSASFGRSAVSTKSVSSSATVSNNEETDDADAEESESGEVNLTEEEEDVNHEKDKLDKTVMSDDDDDDDEEDNGALFGDDDENLDEDQEEEMLKAELNNFEYDDEDEDENEDQNGHDDVEGYKGKKAAKNLLDDTDDKDCSPSPTQKMNSKIEEIHEAMLRDLDDKPWQLKGEVSAKSRPQDSLLEEYVEFDHTTRQAPIIDATFTERLEKLIKQRIRDKAFDDVERKIRPVEMHYEYKKQIALDSEKSKLGLGQIYEQDYLKQQQRQIDSAAEPNSTSNKEVLSNPKHEEIRKRLQNLFIKLDALSNFHFTPKAPTPEVKVVSNMPTINMEEVAPVNVADSNVFAPEEIKVRIKGLPKSKTEEEKTDKNRKLRTKKLISRRHKIEKEKRLEIAHAVDPNNVVISKQVALNKLKKQAKNMSKNIKILQIGNKDKSDKAYRSSSSFFKQLQENAEMKNGTATKKKKATDHSPKNSKKFKL